MSTKKVYLAGPMSGIPEWNYPSFNSVARRLRSLGWTVFNPAEKDVEMGYDDKEAKVKGDTALSIAKGTFDFREAYLWDVARVIESDAIFMLADWEQSPGARGEHAVAVAMKKNYPTYQILYEDKNNNEIEEPLLA